MKRKVGRGQPGWGRTASQGWNEDLKPGLPDPRGPKQQGGFDLGQAQWECTSIVSGPKVAGMGRLELLNGFLILISLEPLTWNFLRPVQFTKPGGDNIQCSLWARQNAMCYAWITPLIFPTISVYR